MQKKAKKALSLFLCVLLCLTLLPAAAFAEYGAAEENSLTVLQPENTGDQPEGPKEEPAPAEETAGLSADPEPAAEQEKSSSGDAEEAGSGSLTPMAIDGGVSINESNFPDANFRAYVSENFDSDGDGLLSSGEIAGVTSISCGGKAISSLVGIGFFTSLKELYCTNNQLTELDVSGCTQLTDLYCSYNQLTSLNVSGCTQLEDLYCSSNQLTELDVSGCPELAYFYCNTNQLSALDVISCVPLNELDCSGNQLSALDVSGHNKLVYLQCSNNQLTSLDVSGTTALIELHCEFNQIDGLDVSSSSGLTKLYCTSNHLTELDVSNNPSLVTLACSINQIAALDVSRNSYLRELNCSFNQLGALDVRNNTLLKSLSCDYNAIAELDVSNNPALIDLSCGRNQLTELDVSDNPSLTALGCGLCQLTALDLSQNTALKSLYCDFNQLTALDVSNNSALEVLGCGNNELTELDVSGNPGLVHLACGNNQLTALDLSRCTALETLDCTSNQLTELNISGCTALKTLECASNQLAELKVNGRLSLEILRCDSNQLTALDVSGCPALIDLYCWNNRLTALDLSRNTALTELDCAYNRLTTLDLSNNQNLQSVAFNGQSTTVWQFTQSGEKYTIDLSLVVGAENTGKIAMVDNGDYDPETGIASFDTPCNFTYYYGTGYGDTHMGVYCSIGVTSFEQLKQLAALEYAEETYVYYVGTGTFVFEEDLVLPENLYFSTGEQDILIPAGVTVTTNFDVYCSTLTVEGTLIAYAEVAVDNVNVSGSAEMHAPITLWYPGSISGEDNIRFCPSEECPRCGFLISYNVTSWEMFEEIQSEAGANMPNRYYDLRMHIGETLTIDKEITIGENMEIHMFDPVVITENGLLRIDYFMQVSAPVTVKGTLINNGSHVSLFGVSGYHNDVRITLEEAGSYRGSGKIYILLMGYSPAPALEEVLPGFDLTEFDVVEEGEGEGDWTLTPKAIPGDANGDGAVNTMDLIRLMKYLTGNDVDLTPGTADVNGDGTVNTMDLIRLMKYISGEDVELL